MRVGRVRLKPFHQRIVVAVADVVLLLASLVAALWITHSDVPVSWTLEDQLGPHVSSVIMSFVLFIVLFSGFRLYRYAWRYAGMEVVRSVIAACALGTAGSWLIQYFLDHDAFPVTVYVVFWVVSTVLVGASRLGLRVYRSYEARRNPHADDSVRRKRALIIGASEHSAQVLRAMSEEHSLQYYDIVGMLDDSQDKWGVFYGNAKVLGGSSMLDQFLEEGSVDEVIFALPEDYEGSEIRQQVLECRQRKVAVKTIPNMAQLLTRPSQIKLEDISVEDLLRRPMRRVDVSQFAGYLSGKRVLVTGAGGSIGSEICRQVAKLEPLELILLGHGENSIFKIHQELLRTFPGCAGMFKPVIASITDDRRMDRIFSRFRPEVVFHAAAHKHVPLMEQNLCEAVHNNVIGTNNIVQACIRNSADLMVQISTDKAADPSSVMGATKWLCEALVRSAASRFCTTTTFMCVRFGNVFGSRGSVIPVFEEQIRNGGPVTVTHSEMTRYFMTIPEAVRLVMQAGSVGASGDVYLLDMGQPVRILDLARDMIRLHGYEPDVDIPIVFTGIRPGEKLHEQLASTVEEVEDSPWDGMTKINREQALGYDRCQELVVEFRGLVNDLDGGAIIELFAEVIPGYAVSARTNCYGKVS